MKSCPNCQSSVRDTAKFCVKCGLNIKKHEDENANKEYFCSECGTKFAGGSFCPECGFDVSEDIFLENENVSVDVSQLGAGFDFGALNSMAQEQLYEKEGFVVENDILTAYRGKKRILTVPGTVEEIFDGSFANNEVITYVELQEGIKIIGKRAFANCSSLVKINIPSTVKRIYDDTFEGVALQTLVLKSFDVEMIKPCLSEGVKRYLDVIDFEDYVTQDAGGIAVDIKGIEDNKTKHIRKKLQKGAYMFNITFGLYYQSNSKKREPIKWHVFKREGNKTLLLSEYVLDVKPFSEGNKTANWDDCSLRTWLNGEFLKNAFDEDEQKLIIPNPDMVLLPSCEDIEREFLTQEGRAGVPTAYAKDKGVGCHNGHCFWWTNTGFAERSSLGVSLKANIVYCNGAIGWDWVMSEKTGVRPMVWVDIDSDPVKFML